MITTVVFDLDGLLMDTEPVWHQARVDLFARYGLLWTKEDQEQCVGVSTSFWVDYMVQKLGGQLSAPMVMEEILSRMASSYASGDVRILPGAHKALKLTFGRYRLGLASGSPHRLIDAALEGAKWAHYFEHVVSSDDVGLGKPAPDVYVEIIRRMGVQAAETAVVEDSGNGILAGVAAGASVIAVPNRYIEPSVDVLKKAAVIIESLAALPAAIDQLITSRNEKGI